MVCHNQRITEQPERPNVNTEEFYALLDQEEEEGAE